MGQVGVPGKTFTPLRSHKTNVAPSGVVIYLSVPR